MGLKVSRKRSIRNELPIIKISGRNKTKKFNFSDNYGGTYESKKRVNDKNAKKQKSRNDYGIVNFYEVWHIMCNKIYGCNRIHTTGFHGKYKAN